MKKLLTAALVGTTMVTLVSSGSANAAIGYLGTSDGQIGSVDLATGVFTPIVDTGLGSTLGDIAVSNSGVMFANSLSSSGGNNFLYRVDLNSKATTAVGDENANNLAGLAFDTDTNKLYGSSFAQTPNPGAFFSVNASTGPATFIASIPGFSAAGDIAYNPSTQTFFATSTSPDNSTLFSIALDGTASEIGNIGYENVFGLILDGGTLYGFTRDGQQLTLNTSTGLGTLQNSVTGLGEGIRILGASPTAVPEPLTILGYMTAMALGGGLKRKLKSKYSSNS